MVMSKQVINALLAAQKEFPEIPRDATGSTGGRSYKYASLPAVQRAVFPILHEHGLVVVQVFTGEELQTNIYHESGDALVSTIPCADEGLSPQKFGAKITYYRRYALVAALGLAPDEDVDAAGVVEPAKKKLKKLPGELDPVAYDDVVSPPKHVANDDFHERIAASEEEWSSPEKTDKTDELLDTVKKNFKAIDDPVWHRQILMNYLGVRDIKEDDKLGDIIETRLDDDALLRLIDSQRTKIKMNDKE
jgi:hypothetical protein